MTLEPRLATAAVVALTMAAMSGAGAWGERAHLLRLEACVDSAYFVAVGRRLMEADPREASRLPSPISRIHSECFND